MASKRRNMFSRNKKQETTEIEKGYEDAGYDHGDYDHHESFDQGYRKLNTQAGERHDTHISSKQNNKNKSLESEFVSNDKKLQETDSYTGLTPSLNEKSVLRLKRPPRLQQYRGTRDLNSHGAPQSEGIGLVPGALFSQAENTATIKDKKDGNLSGNLPKQNAEANRDKSDEEKRPTEANSQPSNRRAQSRRRRPTFRRGRTNSNSNIDTNQSKNNTIVIHTSERSSEVLGYYDGPKRENKGAKSHTSRNITVFSKDIGSGRTQIDPTSQSRWKKEYSTIKRENITDNPDNRAEIVWNLNSGQRNTRHPSIPRDLRVTDHKPVPRITREYKNTNFRQAFGHSNRARGSVEQYDEVAATKQIEQLTLAHLSSVGNNTPLLPVAQSRQVKTTDLVSHRNNGEKGYSASENSDLYSKRIKRSVNDKYPFYNLPQWILPGVDSPVRYAINPKLIVKKSEGEMNFYKSRDVIMSCSDPSPPEKGGHKSREDDQRRREGKGGLGASIMCFKIKYFGKDPFDNPLFKESFGYNSNNANTQDAWRTSVNLDERHNPNDRPRRVTRDADTNFKTEKPMGFTDVEDFLILSKHKTTTIGPPISIDEFMKRLNITGASKTRPPLTRLQGIKSRHNPPYSSRYKASELKNLTETPLLAETTTVSSLQAENRVKFPGTSLLRRLKSRTPKPHLEGNRSSTAGTPPPTTTIQSTTPRLHPPKRSLPRAKTGPVDAIAVLKRQRAVSTGGSPPFGQQKHRSAQGKSQRKPHDLELKIGNKNGTKPNEPNLPAGGSLELSSTAKSVLGKGTLVYTVDPVTGEGMWLEQAKPNPKKKSGRRYRKKQHGTNERNSTSKAGSSQQRRSGRNDEAEAGRGRQKSETRKRKRTKKPQEPLTRRQDVSHNTTENPLNAEETRKVTRRIPPSFGRSRNQKSNTENSTKPKTQRYYRKSFKQ
ncbi:hypothetical protein AAG570_010990 [Ranatra chinensis]|uniref:Uncharacterized protein n=1 Tax=Ranatra chinensis TaxID=642074 RepID=A0ABD0YJB3_9HEMI